jgi:hypothetical protein
VKPYRRAVLVDNYVVIAVNRETDCKFAGCKKLKGEASVVMTSLTHDYRVHFVMTGTEAKDHLSLERL